MNMELLMTLGSMKLAVLVGEILTEREAQQVKTLEDSQAMLELTKELMPEFIAAIIAQDTNTQKALAQKMADAIRLQLRPKLDERTAKFIGYLLYDLNQDQTQHLGECLMHGTELPALDKLFEGWDGKELTEQQVAAVGASL